jgi:hypothetical protein
LARLAGDSACDCWFIVLRGDYDPLDPEDGAIVGELVISVIWVEEILHQFFTNLVGIIVLQWTYLHGMTRDDYRGVILTMLPLARSDMLRQEADLVLGFVRLYDILRPYGKVLYTGSYFLDVMVYPDIDLYITKVSINELFEIGAQIASCELVTQVVFERTDDPVHLPEGLYLKSRVNYGDWGRPWKIDMWTLKEEVILQKIEDMRHYKIKMTPALREQIIRYKLSVLTSQKRTPRFSGYYIYKAFIDEGLTNFESVTRYLISNGIQIEVLE